MILMSHEMNNQVYEGFWYNAMLMQCLDCVLGIRENLGLNSGDNTILCMAKVEQALRPALNLIFHRFNCVQRVLKSQHILS